MFLIAYGLNIRQILSIRVVLNAKLLTLVSVLKINDKYQRLTFAPYTCYYLYIRLKRLNKLVSIRLVGFDQNPIEGGRSMKVLILLISY